MGDGSVLVLLQQFGADQAVDRHYVRKNCPPGWFGAHARPARDRMALSLASRSRVSVLCILLRGGAFGELREPEHVVFG